MASATWADWQDKKKPNTESVIIVFDPEPGQRSVRARVKLAQAQAKLEFNPKDKAAKSDLSDAEAGLLEAEQAQQDACLEFRFENPGGPAFDDLLTAHRPTKQQLKDLPNLRWNPDTFEPALVAACCIEPADFDEDAAKMLWHDARWNKKERDDLFAAAYGVCETRQQVWELGKGSKPTED